MKEAQASVTEWSPRFSNVPATLIHLGMLNIDLGDEELRSAAYDLLGAVCSHLGYNKNSVVASKGLDMTFFGFLWFANLFPQSGLHPWRP